MTLKKRSVTISGHSTSISMEDEFWSAFDQIAQSQKKSMANLISEIDEKRRDDQNLSSAIRVYILKQLQNKTVT
jgi:predicted DNA-binding ribbon-helix-helix protein